MKDSDCASKKKNVTTYTSGNLYQISRPIPLIISAGVFNQHLKKMKIFVEGSLPNLDVFELKGIPLPGVTGAQKRIVGTDKYESDLFSKQQTIQRLHETESLIDQVTCICNCFKHVLFFK